MEEFVRQQLVETERRVTALEHRQAVLEAEHKAHKEAAIGSLDELKQRLGSLHGDLKRYFEGSNGTPGMVTRLDRLEQAEGRRSKHLWGITLVVLPVLAERMVEVLRKLLG